ncbi:putative caspase-like protein [Sinorhizobium terangae]|uniref:Caspase family protein n=1 Tax=Sinorhizobium terangae TaxID=110322 RepID=A0A6N7LEQ1_SINTE|nr:caspase family protein [Sinorhizobium terangae]MBB4189395.1 putative caspase-like protein [Sinorhizobium terangae]MQX15770.1 caspase family protein [Sinorhizobium terangae]
MTRKALVIGNRKYNGAYELRNAVNDANSIADALTRNGFAVQKLIDATSDKMKQAALDFGKSLAREGAGVFYFAGHGVQIKGENYLVGLDADHTNQASTEYHSLQLSYVVSLMDGARTETNIIILDACRNNPWDGGWSRSGGLGGLAPISAPRGTLIAFSTSPGQKSLDGLGSNGRYTEALLQHIDAVCPVETMFKRVRATLAAASTNEQVPWEHTSLVAEFYFNRSRRIPTTNYASQAVQDGIFIPDPANPGHALISALRSHNWPDQNRAADHLDAMAAIAMTDDECFLAGRGLYSASVGDARRATTFIDQFVNRTIPFPPSKRKAVLDGILFEIFFDRAGKVRMEPKTERFDAVFEIAILPDLRNSLEFVAECLVQTGKSFHAFPDFDLDVAVDVLTEIEAGQAVPAVKGIMAGGRNILAPQFPDEEDPNIAPIYQTISEQKFRQKLSSQAAIPISRLKMNYPDLVGQPLQLRFPYGQLVRWMI